MAAKASTPATDSQIKPAHLRKFHAALARWYAAQGRHDLPWRNTDDPYHIWLSEVMLQQTQVATVRDRFYGPFLARFPTIEALAAAPLEAVLKAWEGLGYYSRARNLWTAAQQVSGARCRVPAPLTETWNPEPETLLALPGIGRNTAQAILAFAYHQPVAILEANVKRVVARVFAFEKPRDAELWAGAEALLDRAHPFDYNQAMMDLGSLICTPKAPKCAECPARLLCRGKASPEAYPARKAKKAVPTREVIILAREDARGRLFLEARDAKLLGGLYGFPQSPHPKSRRAISTSPKGEVRKLHDHRFIGDKSANRAVRATSPLGEVENPLGFSGEGYLGMVTHTYSHFKLIGQVVHEVIKAKSNSPDWYTRTEIHALPLSTLDRKVLALVENCHTRKKKSTKPRPASRKD